MPDTTHELSGFCLLKFNVPILYKEKIHIHRYRHAVMCTGTGLDRRDCKRERGLPRVCVCERRRGRVWRRGAWDREAGEGVEGRLFLWLLLIQIGNLIYSGLFRHVENADRYRKPVSKSFLQSLTLNLKIIFYLFRSSSLTSICMVSDT